VSGTNFHFQCLVSDIETPHEHIIVPALVVADGVVECHAPVSAAGVSIAARETLAPPAEEVDAPAAGFDEDLHVPVDGFRLETPPIPTEVEHSQLPIAIIATCSTVVALIFTVVCASFRSSWAAACKRALRRKASTSGSSPFRSHSRLQEPPHDDESSLVEFASAKAKKATNDFAELTEAKVVKSETTIETTESNQGSSTAKLYSALDEAGAHMPAGSSDSAATPSIDIVFDEDLKTVSRAASWDGADVDDSADGIQPVSSALVESTTLPGVSAAFIATKLPSPRAQDLSDCISDSSSEMTEEIFLE